MKSRTLFHGTAKHRVRSILVEGFNDSSNGNNYDSIRKESGKDEIVFLTDVKELLEADNCYECIIECQVWDAFPVETEIYPKNEFVAAPDDIGPVAVWFNGVRDEIEKWM